MGVRPTKFPKGHPIVDSLPAVNLALGGTPNGITINGVWDVATQTAKLTFDASASSDVAKYELRYCAGPNDNTNVESLVANLPPDAHPRVLHQHRPFRHRQKKQQCRQRAPPVAGQPQSRLLGGPSWNRPGAQHKKPARRAQFKNSPPHRLDINSELLVLRTPVVPTGATRVARLTSRCEANRVKQRAAYTRHGHQ